MNDVGEGSGTGIYFKEMDECGQYCWVKLFVCEELSYQTLLHTEYKFSKKKELADIFLSDTSCFNFCD